VEQVLKCLEVWGSHFFLGAVLMAISVAGYVRQNRSSSANRMVRLLAGAALMATGLLHLLDLVSQKWVWVDFSIIFGILCLWEGIRMPYRTTMAADAVKSVLVLCGLVLTLWGGLRAHLLLIFG
jgi:hypothetical protein